MPVQRSAGLPKSAASRRFVPLSAERLEGWVAWNLSKPDQLVIQIDGIRIEEHLVLLDAVGTAASTLPADRARQREHHCGAGGAKGFRWLTTTRDPRYCLALAAHQAKHAASSAVLLTRQVDRSS
jgi:hypothetical protein